MAESIKKSRPQTLIVFTDVYNESGETAGELQSAARDLGAACFKQDIAALRVSSHKRTNRIRFFIIGENEDENMRQASWLINAYGNISGMELYLFSDSVESSLLLQSISVDGMKIRRIDENKSFITQLLYDRGADLFQNAVLHTNGKKEISAVILGLGHYGTEMLKALSWFGQMDNSQLSLTAIDCRNDAEDRFTYLCPELMSVRHNGSGEVGDAQYTICIHSGIDVLSSKCLDILMQLASLTYVFVALGDDSKNVECAVHIRELCERMGMHPQIHAVVFNDFSSGVLCNAVNFRGTPYDIQFVGSLKARYNEQVILNSKLEDEALKRHLLWGEEDSFWRYEFNYRSSVASALHQRVKIQCGISGADKDPAARTPEDRDRLRLIEHRRWNAYMRSEGYCYSGSRDKASRNDMGKLHHDLVPFDMLTEEEKQKDDV